MVIVSAIILLLFLIYPIAIFLSIGAVEYLFNDGKRISAITLALFLAVIMIVPGFYAKNYEQPQQIEIIKEV